MLSVLKEAEDQVKPRSVLIKHIYPRYSIQQIIQLYQTSSSDCCELSRFPFIYVKEFLKPECFTFDPPQSEINSTIYLSGKNPKQTSQANLPRKSQRGFPKMKRENSKPMDSIKSPAEDENEITWWYKDNFDNVIGPYPYSKLHEWFGKRYFDSNLMVCLSNSDDKFQPLSTVLSSKSHINGQKETTEQKGITLYSLGTYDAEDVHSKGK